jgi:hypothetical protein
MHTFSSWQGQSTTRGHPTDRNLHVLCRHAAGLRRGHPLALAICLDTEADAV